MSQRIRSSASVRKPGRTFPPLILARETDVPALLVLKDEVVNEVFGPKFAPDLLTDWKRRFVSREYFADRFDTRRQATEFFITGPRTRPTGMIALKHRDGVAYIGDLYVRRRGHGLGRRLVEHALNRARALGFQLAAADVFDGAAEAALLFKTEGFSESDAYTEPSLGVQVHRLTVDLAEPV